MNRDEPALNWCVNYAKKGLLLCTTDGIKTQIPYILSNMTRWRGERAKAVRFDLKDLEKRVK